MPFSSFAFSIRDSISAVRVRRSSKLRGTASGVIRLLPFGPSLYSNHVPRVCCAHHPLPATWVQVPCVIKLRLSPSVRTLLFMDLSSLVSRFTFLTSATHCNSSSPLSFALGSRIAILPSDAPFYRHQKRWPKSCVGCNVQDMSIVQLPCQFPYSWQRGAHSSFSGTPFGIHGACS